MACLKRSKNLLLSGACIGVLVLIGLKAPFLSPAAKEMALATEASLPIPPIDAHAPKKTETASFALG